MFLDITSPVSDRHFMEAPNLGYPSSLLKASCAERVLEEFRENGFSVLWRDPLDMAVSNYVEKLTRLPQYQSRMENLHSMVFRLKYGPNGQIEIKALVKYQDNLAALNILAGDNYFPPSSLFPETEAKSLVKSFENLAWRAKRVLRPKMGREMINFYMRFNTLLQTERDTGHTDPTITLGKSYSAPCTWAAPPEAFRQSRGFFYSYVDHGRIVTFEPGDEIILSCPHGEGTLNADHPLRQDIKHRLWAGVMAADYPMIG